jgi:hypothetical protein
MLFKKIHEELNSLHRKIRKLETFIEQDNCAHRFVFIRAKECFCVDILIYRCDKCGEEQIKFWTIIPKEEQQALKNLNLVPTDWPVTAKGDN